MLVWALPVSLAATQGIDFSFFSSAYLDVSVQRVSFLIQDTCSRRWVVPFGDPRVNRLCAPDRGFSQLAASFFASESLGIRRVLLLVSSVPGAPIAPRPVFPMMSMYSCAIASSAGVPESDRCMHRCMRSHRSLSIKYERNSTKRGHPRSSRKEVFQPHLPVRLPCYDLAPVTSFTLGRSSRRQPSGTPGFHGLTGGVYKARERIHRAVADARLLAIPASRSRVADSDPN